MEFSKTKHVQAETVHTQPTAYRTCSCVIKHAEVCALTRLQPCCTAGKQLLFIYGDTTREYVQMWVFLALSWSHRCTYVDQYEKRALVRTSPVFAVVHIPLAQRTQPNRTQPHLMFPTNCQIPRTTTATIKCSGLQLVPRIRCKHGTGHHKQAQAADVSNAFRAATGTSVSGRDGVGVVTVSAACSVWKCIQSLK